MFCPYCGKATVESALFCKNCGKPLSAIEKIAESLETESPESNDRPEATSGEFDDDVATGSVEVREELKSQDGATTAFAKTVTQNDKEARSTMICQNCGKETVDGSLFCGNCGKPMSSAENNGTPSAQNTPEPTACHTDNLPHMDVLSALRQVFAERGNDVRFVVPLSQKVWQGAQNATTQFRSLPPGEEPLALFGSRGRGGTLRGILVTDAFVRWRIATTSGWAYAEGKIEHSKIVTIGFADLGDEDERDIKFVVNDELIGKFADSGTGDGLLAAAVEFCELVTERPPLIDIIEEVPHPVEWMFNGNAGEKLPTAWFSYAIAGLCTLMCLLQWMMGAFDSDAKLVRVAHSFGADIPIWGHLVCSFMHGGFIHFVCNMIVLVTSCVSVERTWGTKVYASVYLASVLGAGIGAAMLEPYATSVGASGGIFGIMGAICSFGFIRYFRTRPQLTVFDRKRVFKWIKGYGSLLMGNIYFTAKLGRYGGISIGGHLGGLLSGLALGIVALLIVPPRRDFSAAAGNQAPQDNPSSGGGNAKDKLSAAARWCREKVVALWQSGVKGKALCIGAVTVLALLVLPRGLLVSIVIGAVAVMFVRSRRSSNADAGKGTDKHER